MTFCCQSRMCLRPGIAGWWMGVFNAVFFIFYIHYIPFHLATENHLSESLLERMRDADGVARVQSDDFDADHHHVPHYASEHAIRLVTQLPIVLALVDFVSSEAGVLLCPPQPRFELFLTERQNPPGLFDQTPAQPRGPPTV